MSKSKGGLTRLEATAALAGLAAGGGCMDPDTEGVLSTQPSPAAKERMRREEYQRSMRGTPSPIQELGTGAGAGGGGGGGGH